MKKTLLAAALIAGFAGVAQAETSVTLYGILDGGIGYNKVSGNDSRTATPGASIDGKRVGIIQHMQAGNRWGLKGSEDLGNGLRAVFQLESGFNLTNGTSAQGGRLFGRQATVGLAGDSWGQLDLGRQTNIASKYFGSIDPFGTAYDQANIGVAFTAANTTRYDNMVMYQSPSFSGFQFGVGYSFDASGDQAYDRELPSGYNTKDANQKAVTTGLRYANGPVNVALTYDQVKAGAASLTADNVTIKSWALGGVYDFEVVKAHLAFGQTRNGLFSAQSFGDQGGAIGPAGSAIGSLTGARGLKVNSYMAGVSAPIGNGTLMASWTMADPRTAPDAAVVGSEWDKQQTYSLGYSYGLSKRTSVYAIGSYAKHIHFLPDAKSTLVGVGVNHRF
ncbi:MAG TPA: porin [Candidimonas sp.]|nr:porin [Candidimonas sp.]